MKKTLSLLLVAVFVTGILWAGGQSQSKAAASGKTEIRAAWWGDTKRHELYNQILDEFEKANPDIVVVREPTSWNDYWDKLSVQAAGGNAPDFIGMHPQFVDTSGQSSWGSLFAMSCLSLVPLFIVFVIFQRYLIEGITTGSLKG